MAKRQRYRFTLIPRAYSVVIHDDEEAHPVNYVASAQVSVYGDAGWMHSMSGEGFYNAFSKPGSVRDLMAQLGVTRLEGYVLPAHARLLAGSAAMTEGYAALGAAATLPQLLYEVRALLAEKSIVTTTLTTKKLDGSTTAATYTLDDATTPTSITRAT